MEDTTLTFLNLSDQKSNLYYGKKSFSPLPNLETKIGGGGKIILCTLTNLPNFLWFLPAAIDTVTFFRRNQLPGSRCATASNYFLITAQMTSHEQRVRMLSFYSRRRKAASHIIIVLSRRPWAAAAAARMLFSRGSVGDGTSSASSSAPPSAYNPEYAFRTPSQVCSISSRKRNTSIYKMFEIFEI